MKEILSLVGIFLTIGIAVISSVRYNAEQISKARTKAAEDLLKAKSEGDNARGRIYARFDEFKKEMEERVERQYVRKDIHDLHIAKVERDISEIKIQTAFIPSISAKLSMLLAKAGVNEDGNKSGGIS